MLEDLHPLMHFHIFHTTGIWKQLSHLSPYFEDPEYNHLPFPAQCPVPAMKTQFSSALFDLQIQNCWAPSLPCGITPPPTEEPILSAPEAQHPFLVGKLFLPLADLAPPPRRVSRPQGGYAPKPCPTHALQRRPMGAPITYPPPLRLPKLHSLSACHDSFRDEWGPLLRRHEWKYLHEMPC